MAAAMDGLIPFPGAAILSRAQKLGEFWVVSRSLALSESLRSAAQLYWISCQERLPPLSAALWGGSHTYIKYEGRGWREALDTDVGQHFKHVAFPARHVDEPERTMQGTKRTLTSPPPATPSSGSVLWKGLEGSLMGCLAAPVRNSSSILVPWGSFGQGQGR